MSSAVKRGKFITLEGGEGAGKSMQVLRLSDSLKSMGLGVVTTREPGGSPGAEEIRKLLVEGSADRWEPIAETLLHFAARHAHLSQTIRPALVAGNWVISDRFGDSTMAYQGYGLGLGRALIDDLNRTIVGSFATDLTLILDTDVEEGLARSHAKARETKSNETRYEEMSVEFHRRLRDGFLEIAKREPARCVVIEAGLSKDEVAAKILETVKTRLFDGGNA